MTESTRQATYIVGSDYDGTIRRDGIVSDEDLQAIRTFQAKGHLFGIVTGRSLGMIVNELRHFAIPYDFLIACNGSIIADKNNNVIYRKDISFPLAQEIIGYLLVHAPMFGISDGNRFATWQRAATTDTTAINSIIDAKACTAQEIVDGESIASFFIRGESTAHSKLLMQELAQRFAVTVYYNNGTVDVGAQSCSKMHALEVLQVSHAGSTLYAIGDGQNDAEMIRAFGQCAMSNAVKEVLDCAVHTFDTIAQFLDYIQR